MPCDRCPGYRESGWQQCLKCNSKLEPAANTSVDVHKKEIIDGYSAFCGGNNARINGISTDEPLFISRWDTNAKPIVYTKTELENLYPILRHYTDWPTNVLCLGQVMGANKNIAHLSGNRKESPDGRPIVMFKRADRTCNLLNVQLADLKLIGKVKKDRVAELLAECIGLELADDAQKVVTADDIRKIRKMQEAQAASGQ